jgi:hypothetical protein
MNSKERVLRALDHKTSDRVPVDFYQGLLKSGIEAGLKSRLIVTDFEALRVAMGPDIR